ncbi:hypothetical protein TraAM80_00246 [Trypanosoma rangeli]|uniref:Uncharacterized protein n=1 Tax=Trypanosoma rangeli TaxID=5698 RepID=A0A3R7N459_TRYRA|nr:uncharacterized protein TraAM80_00246 [Trypanosoma rangeli]RNF12530.1 hypothetical protein TraAM80_00246 [Trypanosoma rangeli]|eukprot:RNF12530.1 hypothetical protein TraAM80_00246 [Trypanosoma rangeli]
MAYALQPSSYDTEEPSPLNIILKVRRSPNQAAHTSHDVPYHSQHTLDHVVGVEPAPKPSQLRITTNPPRSNSISQVTVGCSVVSVGSGLLDQQRPPQPLLRIGVATEDTEKMRDRMPNSNDNSQCIPLDARHGLVHPPANVSGTKTWANRPYLSLTVAPQLDESSDPKPSGSSLDRSGLFSDPGVARENSGIQTAQQQSDMTASPSAPQYLRQTSVQNNRFKYVKYPMRGLTSNMSSFYGAEQIGQMPNGVVGGGGGNWSCRAPEPQMYGSNFSGPGYNSSSPHLSHQQPYPSRYPQRQPQRQQQQMLPCSYCNPQQEPQGWCMENDTRYGYNEPNNFVVPPSIPNYSGGGGSNIPMMQPYNNNSQYPTPPPPMQQWSNGAGQPPMSGISPMESGLQRTPLSYSMTTNDGLARCPPSVHVARIGVPSNLPLSSGAKYGGMSANWRTHSRYPNNPQQQSQQRPVPPDYRFDVGGSSPGPYPHPALPGRRPDQPDSLGNDHFYGNPQMNHEFAPHQTTQNTTNYPHQPG